jgi:hypothetical protein
LLQKDKKRSLSAFLSLSPLFPGVFLRALTTQLFRIGNQRAIDFHPIAIMHHIMQLNRATVYSDLVLRQIDIAAQRQQAAGNNRLFNRSALFKLYALQVLLLRQA